MGRFAVTNFSKGEFAPELYGRIDIPQYGAGAKELTNFIVQRYGGATFRPGFELVAEVDDITIRRRMIPFQYSIEQAYILHLEHNEMRVLANGGYILEEDDLAIQSVAIGLQTTLEIPFHDFAVGDKLYFDGVEGMVQLNNRFLLVTAVPDADHVTVDVNSVDFDAFVSSTGILRVAAPPPPPAPPATPTPAPPTTTPAPTGSVGGTGSASGPGTWDGLIRPAIV